MRRVLIALLFLPVLWAYSDSLPMPTWSQPRVSIGGDYWKGTDTAANRVWGFADLHAHFFSNLGHGGRIFHGKAYSPKGPSDALDDCGHDHGNSRGKSYALTAEKKHWVSGWPKFEGWPKYNSLIHQQAYVDWIQRTWQGGLRVVQMDVTNTGVLGKAYHTANHLFLRGELNPLPLDDVSAIENQIAAAKELFENGPASKFAGIAYSADQARKLIESGKLAIVLGIEVEALGNLMEKSQFQGRPTEKIRYELDRLWNLGVRHVIPIHLQRNAFGHPAVFQRILNASNYVATGDWYAMKEGFSRGFRYDIVKDPQTPLSWLMETVGCTRGDIPFPAVKAMMASIGLTDEGEILIREMMKKGFIVDIEHMSDLAADRTLEIAEQWTVPIIASHGSFQDLAFGNQVTYASDGTFKATPLDIPFHKDISGLYGTSDPRKTRNERLHSKERVQRIRNLGGMLGLQFATSHVGVSWRNQIALDCDGSSKSFVQNLFYANELMGHQGVAIGSDVGGFAEMPNPRFGTDACPGSRGDEVRSANQRIRSQAISQRNGVRYAGSIFSLESSRFQRNGIGDEVAYSSDEVLSWRKFALLRSQLKANPPASYYSVQATSAADKVVATVWSHMEEGTNLPLIRSQLGEREWDINLDGVAHYGLIPDFMQDTANVLRTAKQEGELSPLFRSAEDYLRMWKKIETQAESIRHFQ